MLKTELNSQQRISATKTLAVPVYNMLKYTINDINPIDIKTRKLLTYPTHRMHHPKGAADLLYVPRSDVGRHLVQLKSSYKTTIIQRETTGDVMMISFKGHEKNKNFHSVIKDAKKFVRKFQVGDEA